MINLLGDIFKSIGIIIMAAILHFKPNWHIIDLIYTLILSLLIIWTSRDLAWECIHELMGGVPEDLEIKKLFHKLSKIQGVVEVHDMHVWNLIEGTMAISVHVLVDDSHPKGKQRDLVLEKATRICHKFEIYHTTI